MTTSLPIGLSLHGHFWTVVPWLKGQLWSLRPPPSVPFSVQVDESPAGPVRVLGNLRHRSDTRSLLVIVHGLGGTSESPYVIEAAVWAERLGLASLRINMRGASGDGDDIWHAGLYSDVHKVLGSRELDRYERVYLLGYSLGGHISLRYAASGSLDPRLRSVATVCPPIDLGRSSAAFDRPERWAYRTHILASLKDAYRTTALRRPMPIPVPEALAIRRIRAWDALVVARRFGYASAEAYYAQESAAPRLGELGVPTLLIATEGDPMVPFETVRPVIEAAPPSPHLEVKWLSVGGHVGFPSDLSLGFGAVPGLVPQAVHWLQKH